MSYKNLGHSLPKHHGQTIEKVARRSNISLTDLAKKASVSRRTLYNWFTKEKLSSKAISKIEYALNYDFSVELPNYSSPQLTSRNLKHVEPSSLIDLKKHYSKLLEKYRTLITDLELNDEKAERAYISRR